jgi:hypothetical protein
MKKLFRGEITVDVMYVSRLNDFELNGTATFY